MCDYEIDKLTSYLTPIVFLIIMSYLLMFVCYFYLFSFNVTLTLKRRFKLTFFPTSCFYVHRPVSSDPVVIPPCFNVCLCWVYDWKGVTTQGLDL